MINTYNTIYLIAHLFYLLNIKKKIYKKKLQYIPKHSYSYIFCQWHSIKKIKKKKASIYFMRSDDRSEEKFHTLV